MHTTFIQCLTSHSMMYYFKGKFFHTPSVYCVSYRHVFLNKVWFICINMRSTNIYEDKFIMLKKKKKKVG